MVNPHQEIVQGLCRLLFYRPFPVLAKPKYTSTILPLMKFDQNEASWDCIAKTYDLLEQEPAFRVVRQESLRRLLSTFRQGKIILDIGCGTGTEAIALAKNGVTVVAIDSSKAMIDQALAKKKKEKLTNVFFYNLHSQEISRIAAISGYHSFDGGYATFGSLNGEPNLERFARDLRDLLHPGSFFLAGFINKYCLSEMVVHAILRPSRVFRRSSPFMKMSVGGQECMIRLYSVREIKKCFTGFKVKTIKALPVVVPPPHISKNLPEDILEALMLLDRGVSGLWPLNRLGDHIIVMIESPKDLK